MRLILPLSLLALTACNVENDPANEKVTVTYDKERIERTAAEAGQAAKEVATGAANVAEETGEAIEKEVGEIDVDIDIDRNKMEQEQPQRPGEQP